MAQCNPGELIAASFTFRDLDDRQMRMAIIQLLCDISATAGGEGAPPPPPAPSPVEPMMAPPPPGPDPEQAAILAEQRDMIEAQQVEIERQKVEIQSFSAKLKEIQESFADHDDQLLALNGSIGSLHNSIVGKADLGAFLEFRGKSDRAMGEGQTTLRQILGKTSQIEDMLRFAAQKDELQVVEGRIREELADVREMIPKPVEQPVKKPWYTRLRDFSANLFT